MDNKSFIKSEIDESCIKNWEIKSNTSDYNLSRIKEDIARGNENKGGINLKPFYQREYKFTKKDESLLIESLLGGIPIPVIYLASDTTKVPHVSNVIDGQHRLMAVNRFLNNEFALTGLEKFKGLNTLHFSELHDTIQNKLLYQISLKLEFIHVQDDPRLELEIFTRYNQGTNPLTPQEIRHVVLDSQFNDWLIEKVKEWKEIKYIKTMLNINNKRFSDKATHQELYVLLGLFMNLYKPNYAIDLDPKKKPNSIILGINQDYYSSTDYIIEFMSYAKKLDAIESKELVKSAENFLTNLMIFLKSVYFDSGLLYPLSKEIYQSVKSKNYKMQTSIMMIMTSIFFYIDSHKIPYNSENEKRTIRNVISTGFRNSEFPSTTSSTTEPKFLVRTLRTIINEIEVTYL